GGFTFSEKEVMRAFDSIFSTAQGRIIIATFASNIHRIQQIVDASTRYGRKVSLCGKSIVTNADIALKLGYLKMPKGTWLPLDSVLALPDDQIVIVTTGSQGEPMSVLSRIATDEHKSIKIKKGDTVVLSSKMIPGNERSIGKIINHLFRRGADVIYEKVSEVHVSGHASKEELKLMLSLVRPQYFVPVHGEYRHLVYHAKLARKVGIPEENIFILQDGDVLEFREDGPVIDGSVTSGRVFIDGKGDIEDMVLRDRRRLGHDGVLVVIMAMEKSTGRLSSEPDIVTRGFIQEEESEGFLEEAREVIINAIGSVEPEVAQDLSLLKARIRSTLKKYIYRAINRRPMILPIIFEI
ncbi:MAG: ribonuclease J, partial [Nitrospirae bacterium]